MYLGTLQREEEAQSKPFYTIFTPNKTVNDTMQF